MGMCTFLTLPLHQTLDNHSVYCSPRAPVGSQRPRKLCLKTNRNSRISIVVSGFCPNSRFESSLLALFWSRFF
jgi:hypothetical protein